MRNFDEIEIALLGCLFVNRDAIAMVYGKLLPEMFGDPYLGFVYRSASLLFEQGKRPDMPMVVNEMRKLDPKLYSELGGLSFLLPEMRHHTLDYNLMDYVDVICERYQLRKLVMHCDETSIQGRAPGAEFLKEIDSLENKLVALREDSITKEALRSIGEVAQDVVERHARRIHDKDETFRVMSGISDLDGMMGGLHRGELTVLGGMTGTGKTSVAMHIARSVARTGWSVLHFSLEMTPEQTMNRFFIGDAGIAPEKLRIGGLEECDLEKMSNYADKVKGRRYFFVYDASLTVESVRAQAHMLQRRNACDLVVVDYLQLLSRKPVKGETLENVISQNMRTLKMLASELNCAVLVVSQLNRELARRGGGVPILSDLRDSGSIEQVADCVIILQKSADEIDEGGRAFSGYKKMSLWLLKNRNGSTGCAETFRNESFTRFINKPSSTIFNTTS